MENLGESAGQTLRWLRRRRKLTLQAAAQLLHTSAPVLSRKERGLAELEREDVQAVISAFRLDAWEAYWLVTAAGYIPATFTAGGQQLDVQRFAGLLLPPIAYPALIVDELLYYRAWNQGAQAVLNLPHDNPTAVHPITQLFSPHARRQLGERWQSHTEQALRQFQQRTLLIRQRTDYQQLLDHFTQRYGAVFTERWEAAKTINHNTLSPLAPRPATDGSLLPDHAEDLASLLHRSDTAAGAIVFLLTRAAWHFTQNYELNVYLPYGPDNDARYELLHATWAAPQIFYGPPPDLDKST